MLMSVWQDDIVGDGKLAEFLLLASFLLSWGFIRTSAHMIRAQVKWWPGNVSVKGTHVHHMVFGILAVLFFGYIGLAFGPGSPWREICAVGFGIGMGLTLDEFALWLELRDVYWLPDGRKSIDAVIVTGVAGLLLLLGARIWIDAADDTAGLVKFVVGGSFAAGFVLAVVNMLRGHRVAAVARWSSRSRASRCWSCCARRRTRSGSACGSATSPPLRASEAPRGPTPDYPASVRATSLTTETVARTSSSVVRKFTKQPRRQSTPSTFAPAR